MSSKPVIIAETSSSEIGGDKAAWIRHGFLKTIPQQFPRVRAVVWFDRSMEQDWRVDSSQASLRGVPRRRLELAVRRPTRPAAPQVREVKALRVTPSKVTVHSGAGRKAALRAKVVYRLSRRASVRIALASPRRLGEDGDRDDRLTRSGRVRLSTLIRGRRLQRGSYRVVARAIDHNGARSRPRRARFRVL